MNISNVKSLTINGDDYWIILDELIDFNLTIDDPVILSSKEINELSFKRCTSEINHSLHEQYIYNLDNNTKRIHYNITIDFKYKYDHYWDIGEMDVAFMHRNESAINEYENVITKFSMKRMTFNNSTLFRCWRYDGNNINSFGKYFLADPPLHGVTFIAIQNKTTRYHAIKKAVHNELLVHLVLDDKTKNQSIDYIVVNYKTSEVNGNFNASLTNLNMSLIDPTFVPIVTTPTSTTPTVKIGYSGLVCIIISLNIAVIITIYERKNKKV
jgi:hypothetical protein